MLSVHNIDVDWSGVSIAIDGKKLTVKETYALAIADGFKARDEMEHFFREQYGEKFSGILIKWRAP